MLSNCAAVSKLVSHPGNTPPSSYRAALSDASHQFRLVSVTSVDFTSVVFIKTLVLADSGVCLPPALLACTRDSLFSGRQSYCHRGCFTSDGMPAVKYRVGCSCRLSRSPPPSPGSSTVGLSAVGSSGTLYGYAQGPHDAVLPRLPSGLGGDASRAGSSTFFPPGCHDTAPEVDCVDYLAYVDASSPPLVFGYPIATSSAVWTCPVINPIAGLRCAHHVGREEHSSRNFVGYLLSSHGALARIGVENWLREWLISPKIGVIRAVSSRVTVPRIIFDRPERSNTVHTVAVTPNLLEVGVNLDGAWAPGAVPPRMQTGIRIVGSARRCTLGCLDAAGNRALKFGSDCQCVDARRVKGDGVLLPREERLALKRTSNAESMRRTRDHARSVSPRSLKKPRLTERCRFFKIGSSQICSTFHTSQLHVSDSVMANLMCYVDRVSTDQAGAEKSSSVSPCIDPVSSSVWVCKAVGASPDTICGHEIDLRQIANEYMSLGHERLIESALRVAFRAAINGHLLAHLHKIGLKFNRDSHVCITHCVLCIGGSELIRVKDIVLYRTTVASLNPLPLRVSSDTLMDGQEYICSSHLTLRYKFVSCSTGSFVPHHPAAFARGELVIIVSPPIGELVSSYRYFTAANLLSMVRVHQLESRNKRWLTLLHTLVDHRCSASCPGFAAVLVFRRLARPRAAYFALHAPDEAALRIQYEVEYEVARINGVDNGECT
ncbi:hypothetical protein DFH06DRAFT_1131673 [Mycena polygramma]|nr:hypothetical protein DFH06DRAFT_1131673 [Mycena polygramma]